MGAGLRQVFFGFKSIILERKSKFEDFDAANEILFCSILFWFTRFEVTLKLFWLVLILTDGEVSFEDTSNPVKTNFKTNFLKKLF